MFEVGELEFLEGQKTRLPFSGQLDGQFKGKDLAEDILEKIEGKGTEKIILDFKDVKWIDSLGTAGLIALYAGLKKEDIKLFLTNVSKEVTVVLKTCGVIPEIFEVVELGRK